MYRVLKVSGLPFVSGLLIVSKMVLLSYYRKIVKRINKESYRDIVFSCIVHVQYYRGILYGYIIGV